MHRIETSPDRKRARMLDASISPKMEGRTTASPTAAYQERHPGDITAKGGRQCRGGGSFKYPRSGLSNHPTNMGVVPSRGHPCRGHQQRYLQEQSLRMRRSDTAGWRQWKTLSSVSFATLAQNLLPSFLPYFRFTHCAYPVWWCECYRHGEPAQKRIFWLVLTAFTHTL
jgi:hypothetical protein